MKHQLQLKQMKMNDKLIRNDYEIYKSIDSLKPQERKDLENKKFNHDQQHIRKTNSRDTDLRTNLLAIDDLDKYDRRLVTANLNQQQHHQQQQLSSNRDTPKKAGSNAVVVKSVDELAKILVDGVINDFFSKTKEDIEQEKTIDLKFIEENFRYHLTPSRGVSSNYRSTTTTTTAQSNKRPTSTSNGKSELDDDGESIADSEDYYPYLPDEYFQKKFKLEFEDESFDEKNNVSIKKMIGSVRKSEIDQFKQFLKENDAFIFFQLWIEIERLHSILNKADQIK